MKTLPKKIEVLDGDIIGALVDFKCKINEIIDYLTPSQEKVGKEKGN